MGRSKQDRVPKDWMVDLAVKHGIPIENVVIFYDTTSFDYSLHRSKRQRTEDFFNMYFEGVNNG